jgi:hypothetical protein
MLRELLKHLGGTRPRRRNMDGQATACGNAPGDAAFGSDKAGQKTFAHLENSPHRDWRPRLYW